MDLVDIELVGGPCDGTQATAIRPEAGIITLQAPTPSGYAVYVGTKRTTKAGRMVLAYTHAAPRLKAP
jgi:hypothetical protein